MNARAWKWNAWYMKWMPVHENECPYMKIKCLIHKLNACAWKYIRAHEILSAHENEYLRMKLSVRINCLMHEMLACAWNGSLCMKMYKCAWKWMPVHENVCPCMKINACTWKYMPAHENKYLRMKINACAWKYIPAHENEYHSRHQGHHPPCLCICSRSGCSLTLGNIP